MVPNAAENYLDAATTVSDMVAKISPDAWDGTGLGEWDLRSLVGHTSRALITVLTYLHRPADHADHASSQDYYAAGLRRGQSVDEQAVLERGRQAGRELGPDPAEGFRPLLERVSDEIASADMRALITTIAGGMSVETYLSTRTFELVVHGLDIAAAADLPVSFAPATLDEVCQLAARIAVRVGSGPLVLRALTGRADLPGGFSIVG